MLIMLPHCLPCPTGFQSQSEQDIDQQTEGDQSGFCLKGLNGIKWSNTNCFRILSNFVSNMACCCSLAENSPAGWSFPHHFAWCSLFVDLVASETGSWVSRPCLSETWWSFPEKGALGQGLAGAKCNSWKIMGFSKTPWFFEDHTWLEPITQKPWKTNHISDGKTKIRLSRGFWKPRRKSNENGGTNQTVDLFQVGSMWLVRPRPSQSSRGFQKPRHILKLDFRW